MKHVFFFVCLFFFCLAGAGKLNAEQLIFGTDAWPPFRFINGNQITGFDIDLIKEVGRRLKVDVKINRCPWGRCLHQMKTGEIDMMTGLAYRKERAEYILYAEAPYFACTTLFYVKKGLEDKIRSYKDLYEYEIGYVLHSAYFAPFDKDPKLKKYGVTTEKQLLKMLVYDRLKVIIGTSCQVDYDIAVQNLWGFVRKAAYRPDNRVDLFLGVSKASGWAKKIDQINALILQMKADGFIDALKSRYYD